MSLPSHPIDRIIAEVDAAADELVSFTQDLVRMPTVNPPGAEYEACAVFLGIRPSIRASMSSDRVAARAADRWSI